MVGVKYIASVSFGKDSLAMLLRLIEENMPLDAVVFYDTGMEFQAVYRVRDKAVSMLEQHGIEYVELHPDVPFVFSMLDRPVRERSGGSHKGYGWCGGVCRWGTAQKRNAIRRYKKSIPDSVTDYVGIAADETHRFERERRGDKTLPLVSWGMTEADCLAYCRERGWHWEEDTESGPIDLYDQLDRVSCWCCRNKNLKELKAIFTHLPRYWGMLGQLEAKIGKPMKGEGKSINDLARRFRKEEQD